jgi:hypothetical protein
MFAFGLADVLSIIDEDTEALEILAPFIKPSEYFSPDCLKLASQIYNLIGNPKKSFEVLDRCYLRISDDPELLLKHMEMGFRTGDEDKANKSLLLLQKLQENVEEPKRILKQFTLEKIVELFNKKSEEYDQLQREYVYGKIPRIVLCNRKNIPIYLDWAIRTQKFRKPNVEKNVLTDFTIYSTNGIQIQFNKNGKDRFIPIKAPGDSNEIIIDADGLITIHRLGLMEKLTARYEKIYYPEVLKRILKVESSQYNTHQYRKEKIYRQLKIKVANGEIVEIPAQVSGGIQDQEKRDLSLAQSQDIPLINNFLEKDKVNGFPGIFVLRISQIADFLHKQGRLQNDQCEKIKESIKAEPLLSIKRWEDKMLESSRVVVSEITLQLMEEFDINRMLFEIGIQIVVERESAYQIERNVANLDFGKEVAEWNRDLQLTLKEDPGLQPFRLPVPLNEKKLVEDIYVEAATDSLVYMEQKRLPLLTDDRLVQVLDSRVIPGYQFGTGALLVDLFEKELISLEVYADSFLQLCQWRYRYLLPDIRVLSFYARQYKDALPGKELKIIAAYFRDCMDIPGLFLGTEPTNPPGSIGLHYYLKVVDSLLEFLVSIWENEFFDEKNLNRLTEWFFISGLPDLPFEIPWRKRILFYKGSDKFWITKLFALIIRSENHIRLHELLEKSLKYFSTQGETKKAILERYIWYIKDLVQYHVNKKISYEYFENIALYKGLEVLYGCELKKIKLPPELVSLLIENGFDFKLNEPKIPDEDIKVLKGSLEREIKKIKDQDHTECKTSVLLITQQDHYDITLSVLHNLIRYPSSDIRRRALRLILLSKNISDLTKKKIQSLKVKILSDNSLEANNAAVKVENLLLYDFNYAIALYKESINYQCQDVLKVAWEGLISPTLETVTNRPHMIKKKYNVELNKKRLRQKASSFVDLKSLLDWYLGEFYFIPLDSPLNPWEIVSIFISSRSRELSNLDIFYTIKE